MLWIKNCVNFFEWFFFLGNLQIFENIIEYVNPNFEELKQLRLVSKVWLEGTLPRWRRKTAAIKIIPSRQWLQKHKSEVNGHNLLSNWVNEDKEKFYNFDRIRFANYKLVGFEFGPSLFDENVHSLVPSLPQEKAAEAKLTGLLKTFWLLFGQETEYIEFKKCTFYSTRKKTLEEVLLRKFQGLKRIVLSEVVVKTDNKNFDDEDKRNIVPALRLMTFDNKLCKFMTEVSVCTQTRSSLLN